MYSYKAVFFGHEKEGNLDTLYNMDNLGVMKLTMSQAQKDRCYMAPLT